MAPTPHKETLAYYVGELKRSKHWREHDGYDDLWRRMIDLYRGKQYTDVLAEDRLVINMAFSIKNVISPAVSISDPKFTIEARKPEMAPHAIVAEEALNAAWRVNKYQDDFQLTVDDFLISGHGWMKTAYKFVREEAALPLEAAKKDGEEVGIDDREPIPGNVESESKVLEDRPYSERVSIFDIFVDPDARSMRDIRWIAQRVARSVADIKVDKRYTGTLAGGGLARNKVTPERSFRYDNETADSGRGEVTGPSRDKGFVDVFEFYDVKRNTMCVFIETQPDGFLIPPQPIPYKKGHPFEMLRNYDIPDMFYPMGELEAVELLQYELNAVRTAMHNHRKRYARKYLIAEDAFDADGLAALENDEDNTLVTVKSGADPESAIKPMPAIINPPDYYNLSELIADNIDTVSGTSDYMRGDAPNLRRTATEAAMIQDSQQARAAWKLRRIELYLGHLGERVLCLMQQFMTGEAMLRIVGADGMPFWVNYDRDYIQGDFDFSVEAGSTQPVNESFRRQSAEQLMQAMMPFIEGGICNPQAVMRHVLVNGFGIKNPAEFMQVTPPTAPGAPPGEEPPPEGMPPQGAPLQQQPLGIPFPGEPPVAA